MFWLGAWAAIRLSNGVHLAEVVTKSYSLDLNAYPRWMLVLAGTLVVVVAIWVAMKLLKLTLWLLLFLVFFGGIGWAVWELLR